MIENRDIKELQTSYHHHVQVDTAKLFTTFSKIPGDLGVTKMEALVAIFWVRDRCK